MARKSKGIILNPVLFIACEGTATEYWYFQRWAETDLVRKYFEMVNVYPSKKDKEEENPKTTPYELFEKAKEQLYDESANIAWAVFDKDNHPKLEETFNEASTNTPIVQIAFSSRSFEEWILMHFEKNSNTFNVSECKDKNGDSINCGTAETPDCLNMNNPCLCGHLRRSGHLPDFEKTADFNLYNNIIGKNEIALVNSAWLRYKTNSSLYKQGIQPLRNLNPYTDVDQLVFLLSGREDKIEWGGAAQNISLEDIVVSAERVNGQILVNLSHTNHQAIVLGVRFSTLPFYTTDNLLENHNCQLLHKEYIIQQNGSNDQLLYPGDILRYTLQGANQPYLLFQDISSTANIRIYIEL